MPESSPYRPEILEAFTTFRADVPQIQLNVDRAKVISLGVPLPDVFLTLQTYLGGLYVNDFNLFGCTYRVWVEADSSYRSTPDGIARQVPNIGDVHHVTDSISVGLRGDHAP